MLGTNEKISIVIPVYNSSKYIKKTIDSVMDSCQEYEFEIILVDDLSADIKTLKEIIASYKKAKLIEKNEKSNAAHSRNIGFLNSTYEKVFFLDSDDHFTKEYITHRLKKMQNNKCGVFFGGYTTVINYKKRIPFNILYNKGDIRDYLFLGHGDFRTSTVSINKAYHKGTMFDPQMRKHQDWGLGIRCYDAEESIYYDNTTHVIINVGRGEQMSATMNIEASEYFLKTYITNNEHLIKFIELHIIRAICNKDYTALNFFFRSLENVRITKRKAIVFRIFRLMSLKGIIHFSSPTLSGMKLVKNLLK